jgi:hypothetical protein
MLLYGEAWWTQGHGGGTFDPDSEKRSDLKGKKIGVGLRTQSEWGLNARVAPEYGFGVTPKNTKIFHFREDTNPS